MLPRKVVARNPIEPLEPRRLLTTAFVVQFNDPNNTYLAYHNAIESTLVAAGNEWASKISGTGSIEVQVSFDPTVPTAQTASTVSVDTHARSNGIEIDEQGVAYEMRTGIDSNGSDPDALMTIGTRYLANDLWFDPDPVSRDTLVPADKVDAYSVFLHELEHAFAFNGNRDGVTGTLPATADNVESTFDQYIAADNAGNLFFTGPHAKAVYGSNVPLTFANAFHVGNRAPRPGVNIADDLMNGVGFLRGHRYNISSLDLAMLADAGVPVTGTTYTPTLTIADTSHAEGDTGTTPVTFNVALSSPPLTSVSVDYATISGSAMGNADFIPTHGTLTIPAGQTSAEITVQALGDKLVESDENFSVALSNPLGVVLGNSSATATILNDDFAASRTLTFKSGSTAKYLDASGRPVTVTLQGAGSGTITFSSPAGNADTISLSGTNSRSALTIKSPITSVRKIFSSAPIGTIDASSVNLTSALSGPITTKLALRNLSGASLSISGSPGLTITAQSVTNSSISAVYLKSFSAGAVIGSNVAVSTGIGSFTASTLESSRVYVSLTTPPSALPSTSAAFTQRSASIKSFTVKGLFSSTLITAPTIGTVKLGRVRVSNNHQTFGIAAHTVASINASTPANVHLKLQKLSLGAQPFTESDFSVAVI